MSAEFLPLPMAAAVAYLRLVSHEHRGPASEGLLDVVASALSVWVPLYAGTPRTRLPDALLARGRICNGATRLRFRDGTPPLENLAILQSDLDACLARRRPRDDSSAERHVLRLIPLQRIDEVLRRHVGP